MMKATAVFFVMFVGGLEVFQQCSASIRGSDGKYEQGNHPSSSDPPGHLGADDRRHLTAIWQRTGLRGKDLGILNESYPGDVIDQLPLANEPSLTEEDAAVLMAGGEITKFESVEIPLEAFLLNASVMEADEGVFAVTNETEGNVSTAQVELPPLRDSLSVVIPMTMIYALILISGLVGNISTCVVIAKNNYMHTATNYYLFSLAISDLLLLLSGLPIEMYLIWRQYPYVFGNTFCFLRGLAAETSANATVLTITAFTVERYVAICHPLRSHKLSQLSRVVKGIVSIWIAALILAIPQAAQFGVVNEPVEGEPLIEGAYCTIARKVIPYSFQISTFMFFVIPMTIITHLYVLIGLKLRRSRGPNRNNTELTVEPTNNTRHSQSHVIRMLIAVVVAFFTCWAPFHIQRLMAIYAEFLGIRTSRALNTLYLVIHHMSGILYYVSTCINPILYHIMSNKFREAFKDTMRQLFGKQVNRGPKRTYSNMSHHRASRIHHNQEMQGGQLYPPHSTLETQNSYLMPSEEYQETCINCRHTPLMCACRGNSQHKFVKTYRVEQTGVENRKKNCTNPSNNTAVMSALTSVDFEPRIPKATVLQISKHVRQEKSAPLVAFDWMRKKVPARKSSCDHLQESSATSNLAADLVNSKGHKFSNSKNATGKAKLFLLLQKKMCKSSHSVPSQDSLEPQIRGGEIIINSNTAVTYHGKTLETAEGASEATLLGKHSKLANGNPPALTPTPSQSSLMESRSNSISNSSLQDMDEQEFSGAELVDVLAQMQQSITESQHLV